MSQLFLAPASNTGLGTSIPYENLEKTVLNPAPIRKYREYIPEKYDEDIRIWGVTENNKSTWKQLHDGDCILFYTGGSTDHYEWAAKVRGWKRDLSLARKLWPNYNQGNEHNRATGQAWEYIIFLNEPTRTIIQRRDIQEILGRGDGETNQFHKPKKEHLIVRKYGSINEFIEEYSL